MSGTFNHKFFLFSPLDSGAGKHSQKTTLTNGQTSVEQVEELKRSAEELRQARRAALNLMEDAILSKEMLAKSEEKYRTLFEGIDEGFSVIEMLYDESGKPINYRFVEVNQSFERQTGLKNVVGKTGKELTAGNEPYWIDTYHKVVQTGKAIRFENFHEPTGRWYESYASRAGGAASRQVAIVFNDVTERKKAETVLRESEERKTFLLRISDALHPINDPIKIHEIVTRLAMDHFAAERCYYCEIENGWSIIRKDAAREGMSSVSGISSSLDSIPIFKLAVDAGKPFIVHDVNTTHLVDESLRQLCLQHQMISFIDVPVIKNGQPVGILCIVQSKPRDWTDLEVELSQEVAERTWSAVEKAKVDEALRISEKRTSVVTDSVPQIIWTNEDNGIANFFNQRWYEYSGLTEKESIGKGWEAIVHADDAPSSKEKWQQALATGKIFDAEYRLRRHDGVYRWFIGRNVPLKDDSGKVVGWFGSATDIEDLKRTQEELSESEARLKITMETATDYAIITMDAEGKIERWSSGAAQIFGYTEAEVLGKSGDIIFTTEDRNTGAPQIEMETARDTGRAADERWHLRKDGSPFYASGVLRPITNLGLTGYVKVLRDMTQQQLFTEELHRLVAERTAELQRSNEDLRQFAHVASHDLKEPVRKIMTFNNRILDEYAEELPHQVKTYSLKIKTAADRMISMIEGVLQYSKLGNAEQVWEAVDLNEMISQITNDLEVVIHQKNALVEATDLPTLRAIPTLIHQLFYNLILNSLKFAKEDKQPKINISFEKETVREVEFAKITISDNGIGFEPEYSQQIFKAFTRLHPVEDYEGTGLGLALCKKIVDRHRGVISAHGQLGEGATFTILLPL